MQEPLVYIDCSLPDAMTIAEYRRTRCAQRPRPRKRPRRLTRVTAGLIRL